MSQKQVKYETYMKWPKCDIALVPQLAAGLAGSSATLADPHVLLYYSTRYSVLLGLGRGWAVEKKKRRTPF